MFCKNLVENKSFTTTREEVEYLICTKNNNGDCIVLTNKIFEDFDVACSEANEMISKILSGNILKLQTEEAKKYIVENIFIGKRTKIINTLPIECIKKI